MSHLNSSKAVHPVTFAIKNFIEKLFQNPEVYPIKHYKKVSRLKKNRSVLKGF